LQKSNDVSSKEKFRASKIMEARCVKQNQFDESRYRWFRNEQVVTGVKALNKTTNEALKLATGFFVAIGQSQILIFLKILFFDETGYINNSGSSKQMLKVFCIWRCSRPCVSSSNYGCRYRLLYGNT
jgi:thioredoxin reductase